MSTPAEEMDTKEEQKLTEVQAEPENNAKNIETVDNKLEKIDSKKKDSEKEESNTTHDGKEENEKDKNNMENNDQGNIEQNLLDDSIKEKKPKDENNKEKKPRDVSPKDKKVKNVSPKDKKVKDENPTEKKLKDQNNKEKIIKDEGNMEKSLKDGNKKDKKLKDENDKEDNGKDESEREESEEEKEMGLLDRPVEVTGCRARKQVERLEVSFAVPTKDKKIPEGRGTKLGDCPRIEFQIAKHAVADLAPLHRVLFNRRGNATETKRNIRKFSGFSFDENSYEFDKNRSRLEKNIIPVLKKMCDILDLERGGTKDDMTTRILQFLICPSDSGKALPKRKSSGPDKKSAAKKKGKKDSKKSKAKSSEEEDDIEIAPGANDASDARADEKESSDVEIKKKSKGKSKKTPFKVKTLKKGKSKKETKGLKRKRDVSDSSAENSEPASKKSKLPDDDEIENLVRSILEQADLHEITMKKVIKQVYDTYPSCDLTDKKSFIKQTIKTVLQLSEKADAEDR